MTPLLWDITKQYLLPRSQRASWCDDVQHLLDGVHGYEISSVAASCRGVVEQGHSPNGAFTFAPGSRVFLDFTVRYKGLAERGGYLVCGNVVWHFMRGKDGSIDGEELSLFFEPQMTSITHYAESKQPGVEKRGALTDIGELRFIRAAFSIINRPQHVGLNVHQPHKKRLKKLSGTGFPLHVWHEVTVGRGTRNHEGKQIESQVSGTRPYHHVRAHYKPSLGIVVPEHWRGDPSIGIKRTRYRVEKQYDSSR